MALRCRCITFFLFCFLPLLLIASTVRGDNERKQVTLVFITESPEIISLRDGLALNPGVDVRSTSDLNETLCTPDLEIVAFGSDAVTKMLSLCPRKKLIIVSSRFMVTSMLKLYTPGTWGYYMDQPLEFQVRHADLNMPSIRTLGILYTKSDIEVDQVKKILATPHRIEVKAVEIQGDQVVAQVMRDLYQSVDAVLITGNKSIWALQDFKTYLVLGMRQNKIMIGGYNYLYTNRGSISAIHTDFKALGVKIGQEIMSGHGRGFSYFDKRVIVTNELLAARYGIYIGNMQE